MVGLFNFTKFMFCKRKVAFFEALWAVVKYLRLYFWPTFSLQDFCYSVLCFKIIHHYFWSSWSWKVCTWVPILSPPITDFRQVTQPAPWCLLVSNSVFVPPARFPFGDPLSPWTWRGWCCVSGLRAGTRSSPSHGEVTRPWELRVRHLFLDTPAGSASTLPHGL